MVPFIIGGVAAVGIAAFTQRQRIQEFIYSLFASPKAVQDASDFNNATLNIVVNAMQDTLSQVTNFGSGEVDTLARTIWGEARSEGAAGMQAVANVIMNRVKAAEQSSSYRRLFGSGVIGVCKKPWQFSCWNSNDPNLPLLKSVTTKNPQFAEAVEIAKKALSGTLPDITGGATHYLTKAAYQMHQNKGIKTGSSWSYGETPKIALGTHYFFDYNQTA